MATTSLQCISLSQIRTFKRLLQVESTVTGRAYMGEVLIQIWLKSMNK